MYLAHIPVNHHLRPLYRVLAGLSGLYLVVLGAFGLAGTGGLALTAQEGLPEVYGQQLNPLSAGMVLVFGIGVLAVTALGRNIDHFGNFWLGQFLTIIPLLAMAFLRTDGNVLGLNMTSVIVLMVIGLVVWLSSLYAKVGNNRQPAGAQHAGAQPAGAQHA